MELRVVDLSPVLYPIVEETKHECQFVPIIYIQKWWSCFSQMLIFFPSSRLDQSFIFYQMYRRILAVNIVQTKNMYYFYHSLLSYIDSMCKENRNEK